ncbi:MAG: phosphate ABC transporter permease subunit PstC [Candidatus Binataceae bacterium]
MGDAVAIGLLTRARDRISSASLAKRLERRDLPAYALTLVAATSIIVITGMLVHTLWVDSGLSRHEFGWSFLFTKDWDPVQEIYGALPYIYGTVTTSLVALLIAVPMGLGSAIFLAELAPQKISDALTFLIELLAAVPSVIFGLLGIFVLMSVMKAVVPELKDVLGFLPLFQGPFYGVSTLTAGVVLSIMIVPFIISISREALLAVPVSQREGSASVGATKWETTWYVVVPYASKAIVGSVFLALARALGETMAVTMVIGNNPEIKASLLAPGYSIAAVIANEFTEATSAMYVSALVELGLVLFGLTFVINGVARLLVWSVQMPVARD